MDFWDIGTPFLRSASRRDADIWTDGFFELLRERGLHSFSVSALARALRVSPAAVLQRQSRQGLLLDVVTAFGVRWLSWCVPSPFGAAIPGELPRTEHDRHGVAVWQALREVARGADAAGDPEPLARVRRVRAEEVDRMHDRLERLLDRPAAAHEVTATLVLLDGLRAELAAPAPRLTADEADQLLLDHVQRLRR
jgi:AcrR family transcriptional regulator